MPYNTAPIPPRKEVTGAPVLPLARVKKIISQDQDIDLCSNNAAFIITIATELFIQHLASESQNMAKLDRKPRRNIQYKDVANAVSHNDNLEFLEDLIPKTATFRKIKDQAAATRAQMESGGGPLQEAGSSASAGGATAGAKSGKKQATLDGSGGTPAVNGGGSSKGKKRASSSAAAAAAAVNGNGASAGEVSDDPNAQLEAEMKQAGDRDGDVDMEG